MWSYTDANVSTFLLKSIKLLTSSFLLLTGEWYLAY